MLTLQSNNGDFVHQSQTMAKDEDYSCVSKKWYDKTVSLTDFMDKLESEKKERVDLMVPPQNINVIDDNGTLKVRLFGSQNFVPTEHAWKQMCTWLDVPQTFFQHYTSTLQIGKKEVKRGPLYSKLVCDAFNLGTKVAQARKNDRKFTIRTYKDGTLRAFMSEEYVRINNPWYLEILNKIMPGSRVSHDRFSDCDNVNFNLLIPDSMKDHGDGDYGAMISCGNSEIGTRRFEQCPSIFRAICMNGCIWDQSKANSLSMVHKGKIDLKSLQDEIFTNINTAIPLTVAAIKRFLELRNVKIGVNMVQVLGYVAKELKLTVEQAQGLLKQYKQFGNQESTMFTLIDVITRNGQNHNTDVWVASDVFAGKLLNSKANDVAKIENGARALDKDDLTKIFGIAA